MENSGNLRKFRKDSKLTLEALAEKVGTTCTTIFRYEKGQRKLPVEMAKKIGKVLNVDWWLLYD